MQLFYLFWLGGSETVYLLVPTDVTAHQGTSASTAMLILTTAKITSVKMEPTAQTQ